MQKFKVGDRVRCLYSAGMYPLEKDGIYTIRKVVDNGKYVTIDFEGVEDKGWFVDNFELVQSEEEKEPEVIKEQKTVFKIGDKVRCIDASDSDDELSEGGIYTIKEFVTYCEQLVLEEVPFSWMLGRFELAEKPEQVPLQSQQITLDLTKEQIQYLVQFALERILTERMNQEKINQAEV